MINSLVRRMDLDSETAPNISAKLIVESKCVVPKFPDRKLPCDKILCHFTLLAKIKRLKSRERTGGKIAAVNDAV